MLTNANEMLTFSARSSRKKCQKMPTKYYCENCDYSSNKLSNYDKHLASDKHKVVSSHSGYFCYKKCQTIYVFMWKKI